jgi:CheY-like chemotaxis protein
MGTFHEFERDLRDTLSHLYDPTHRPSESVYRVTGIDSSQGLGPIRAVLAQAIEALKPAPETPPSTRSRRIYEVLRYRYIEYVSQEETAERLGISPRHLRREQQDAIRTLARSLWRRSAQPSPTSGTGHEDSEPTSERETEPPEWRSQVRQEFLALQKSAPRSVADVGQTLQAVVALAEALAAKRHVTLHCRPVEAGLVAAAHPVGLRQILVGGITELLRHMASGAIEIVARREGAHATITMTASPATPEGLPQSELLQELLAMQAGSVSIHSADDAISCRVELPCADQVTVLVVDDNADLVHFLRRYTSGTRYHIVPAPDGQQIFQAIEESAPDVIVLDVMLPDVDGWEVLVNLHGHPATRSIPVIVCSVIREEELALALGAALYLPKPVGRRQFLGALDQVFSQAAGEAMGARGSSAATGPSTAPPPA